MCKSKLSASEARKALRLLSPMISNARRGKITSVVAGRTNNVCVLLENIYDKGNINAVLRSMEAFGFSNVHQVISAQTSTRKKGSPIRTDAGALQWINVRNWPSTEECVRYLKEEQRYKIACASPDAPTSLTQMDFCQKVVLAFGSEGQGISKSLSDRSDVTFSIPMTGFVQSLNISVSAAITLYSAYSQRVERLVSLFNTYRRGHNETMSIFHDRVCS